MMNWNKLLLNRCPKCGKYLDFESDSTMMMCTISCGFMIRTELMQEYCVKRSRDVIERIEIDNKEKE